MTRILRGERRMALISSFTNRQEWRSMTASRGGAVRRKLVRSYRHMYSMPKLGGVVGSRVLGLYSAVITFVACMLTYRHFAVNKTNANRSFNEHFAATSPSRNTTTFTTTSTSTSSTEAATNVAMAREKFFDEVSGRGLAQGDRKLVSAVQSVLLGPAKRMYQGGTFSVGYGFYVDKLLKYFNTLYKKYGFFFEAGAGGGVNTHTLFLETRRGWRGILMEPNPDLFRNLTKKGRQVIHLNSCLSPTSRVEECQFQMRREQSRIVKRNSTEYKNKTNSVRTMTCLPFFSVYQALGSPTIDFLRLSVQGYEHQILQTIPWDAVDITTISMKMPRGANASHKTFKYLYSKGYDKVFQLPYLMPRGLTTAEKKEDRKLTNILIVKSGVDINSTSITTQ